jgi:hypothetical protein
MTRQTPQLDNFPDWRGTVNCIHDMLERTDKFDTFMQALAANTVIKGKGKGHPCTGAEALYRPYGL